MEARNRPARPDPRRPLAIIGAALAVTTAVAIAGCTAPPEEPATLADWCWNHYRLAPPGALAFDAGPTTPEEAVSWSRWLDATSPPPDARQAAHLRQVELVRRFSAEGGWTETERDEYVDAALSDPTPATACEAIGARIIPAADGALPDGWERRFIDPADAAWSDAARREARDS